MSKLSLHTTYKKLFEQVTETLEENKRLKARIVELEAQVASQQPLALDVWDSPAQQALFDPEVLSGLEADTTPPTSK